MFARGMVREGGIFDRTVAPGDLIAMGDSDSTLTTAGAGTWLAAAIATGTILRTGPAGGYTDTTDIGQNIIAALAGGFNYNPLQPDPTKPWAAAPNMDNIIGLSFRFLFINLVAQAMTFAAGATGVTAGAGGSGVLNVAASLVREYRVTLRNTTNQQVINASVPNGSTVVTFTSAQPVGVITPGMLVTAAAGIAANTSIVGVTHGQGVLTGATLSQNSNALITAANLTFSPEVKFDGLRSSTA